MRRSFQEMSINRLLWIVSDELSKRDCTVANASGDADVCRRDASTAAFTMSTTTLIRENTDFLVLLLYHTQRDSKGLPIRQVQS